MRILGELIRTKGDFEKRKVNAEHNVELYRSGVSPSEITGMFKPHKARSVRISRYTSRSQELAHQKEADRHLAILTGEVALPQTIFQRVKHILKKP